MNKQEDNSKNGWLAMLFGLIFPPTIAATLFENDPTVYKFVYDFITHWFFIYFPVCYSIGFYFDKICFCIFFCIFVLISFIPVSIYYLFRPLFFKYFPQKNRMQKEIWVCHSCHNRFSKSDLKSYKLYILMIYYKPLCPKCGKGLFENPYNRETRL